MLTDLKKETQEGLRDFGYYTGIIDGIHGNGTAGAKTKMIKRLLNAYLKNKREVAADYNFGAVRMDNIYTNKFTDWFFMIIGQQDIIMWRGSTKPGLGKVKDPPVVGGKKGVAVLKSGTVRFSLQSAWWSGLPFLLEIPTVTIYRDYNLDLTISKEVEHTDGTASVPSFGINGHSWVGWLDNILSYFSSIQGRFVNLSEGCQVTSADRWTLVIPYFKLYKDKTNIKYNLFELAEV